MMKTFETFTDATTAKLYEPLSNIDQWMEIPAAKGCNCKAFKGWLSDVDEKAAERYVASGGNLIRAKAPDEIDTSKVSAMMEQFKQSKNEEEQ